jgi:TRAP-type mannitol/chloroaromatic compound transport system substrate-binding protein
MPRALFGCLLLVLALPSAHAAEPIKWKMMTFWQAGTMPFRVFEEFAQKVKTATQGQLLIEPLPAGSVVAAAESLDAVSSGILDSQYGGIGYWAGKDPGFALLSDPQGGFETAEQMQAWMYEGGGLALAREMYKRYNVYFVGPVWHGMESLVSKKPLRGVADFKGLKARAPQGVEQDIFRLLGAAPVNLPGSEVYTALERGVIDAADWSTLSMNDELGYHKLAKYPTYPGFHSLPMADIAVNMKRWSALPDDLKALFEKEVRQFSLAIKNKAQQDDAAVAKTAKAHGIELIDWSKQERANYRKVAQEVWKDYAGRSEKAKRVYESQIAYMKKIGLLQ